jgi:hypothetical protein
VARNSPAAAADMMIGIEAPTAVAGTAPIRTRPSATEPAMKLGSPSTAGSPPSVGAAGLATASARAGRSPARVVSASVAVGSVPAAAGWVSVVAG